MFASAGQPSELNFVTTLPTTVVSGAGLGVAPNVQVQDLMGHPVASAVSPITLKVYSDSSCTSLAAGSLSVSSNSVPAVGGSSIFSGVSYAGLVGTVYFGATSPGLIPTCSGPVVILPGAPTQLAWSSQPTNTAAGASFGVLSVTVEDASGNVVPTASGTITLAIGNDAGGGSTLSGSLSAGLSSGTASFVGLSMNKIGTGFTLAASIGGGIYAPQTSQAFNITLGPAAQLVFTTEPSNTAAGAILTSVQVSVEDAGGNVIPTSTANITLSIGTNAGPGGTLSGTLSQTASAGVATFSNLSINKAGVGYTLTSTTGGLPVVTSTAFNILAGPATQLVFITQPSSANSASSLGTITLALEDALGNVETGSTASVSLAIATNAGPGGVLSGTLTTAAVSGVASFPGLTINKIGTGYTLQATGSSFTKVSSMFNITLGPVSQLVWSAQPTSSNITAGSAVLSPTATPLQVTLEDAGGNIEVGPSLTVSITIGSNPGSSTLMGTTSATTTTGITNFNTLALNKAASGYTFTATSGVVTASSSSFTIIAGPPTTFNFSTSTGTGLMNGCYSATITTTDAYANTSNVASNKTFNLNNGSSNINAYPSNTCTGIITATAIPTGVSSVTYYFKDSAYENTSLGATQPGWAITQSQTFFSQTQLVISGPATLTAGSCTAYTVTNEDFNNAPVVTGSSIAAATSGGDPTSSTKGTFGSDSSCTTGTNAITISSGQSSTSVYFSTTIAQTITLASTATNYQTLMSLPVAILGTTPAKLALTGQTAVTTATCSTAFHVSLLDTYGNHTTSSSPTSVTMSTTGSTQFYSDAACGTLLPGGTLTIATSAPFGTFYTQSATSEAAVMTSSGSGLAANSFNLLTQATPVTMVASTNGSTTCVAINGSAKCAGYGANGRLGNGSTSDSFTPVQVMGLTSGVTQLATTYDVTCAIISGIGVKCWGAGAAGDIGNGSWSDQTSPQFVSTLGTNVSQIAAGGHHICALQSGVVYCWGDNSNGQLGQGNYSTSNTPLPVTLPLAAISVSTGPRVTCSILTDGSVWCWGWEDDNIFLVASDPSLPVQIPGLPGPATEVGPADDAICALIAGTPYCWGFYTGVHAVGFVGTYTHIVMGGPSNWTLLASKNDGSIWTYGIYLYQASYNGNGSTGGGVVVETPATSGAVSLLRNGECAVVTLHGQPTLECFGPGLSSTRSYSPNSDGSIGAVLTLFDTFSWL